MLSIQTLLISPFLPGLVFIMVAFVTRLFPPIRINSFYGYRTKKSMSNEENWKIANTYAPMMLLRSGFGLAFVGIICAFFITNITILSAITSAAAVVAASLIFILTERRLK